MHLLSKSNFCNLSLSSEVILITLMSLFTISLVSFLLGSPCVFVLCSSVCVSLCLVSPSCLRFPCSVMCIHVCFFSPSCLTPSLCLSCQAPSLRLVSLVTLLYIYVVCCYSFFVRSVMFMPCFQGFVLPGIYIFSPGIRVQGFLCLLSSFLILGFFF